MSIYEVLSDEALQENLETWQGLQGEAKENADDTSVSQAQVRIDEMQTEIDTRKSSISR